MRNETDLDLRRKRGILFDLGGTLFKYEDMEQAWSDWLQALHRSLVGYGLKESIDSLAARCDGFFSRPEPLRAEGVSVFQARIQALLGDAGLSIATAELGEIETSVLAAWWSHLSLDREATDVLRQLRSRYVLGVVSNFDHPKHLYEVLDQHELTQFFDAIVISGEVGIKKPDPRIMSLALDSLGLKAESCVYVGDIEEDELCAVSAGMRAITIDRRVPGEEPPHLDFRSSKDPVDSQSRVEWQPLERIRSLSELIDLLPVAGSLISSVSIAAENQEAADYLDENPKR